MFAGLLDLGRQGPKEHWVGKISDAEKSAVKVAPEVLDGALFVSAEGRERRRLVPQLATRFSGSGLVYDFVIEKGS